MSDRPKRIADGAKPAPFQLIPPLSPEEYRALKESIKTNGLLVPLEYDHDGNIIDGHHRVRACRELALAIPDAMKIVREYADDNAKRVHAVQLNVNRRQLSGEQKRQLIAQYLAVKPESSDRSIANDLRVDNKTVARVRREKERTEEIPQITERKGKDGKTRGVKNGTGQSKPKQHRQAGKFSRALEKMDEALSMWPYAEYDDRAEAVRDAIGMLTTYINHET